MMVAVVMVASDLVVNEIAGKICGQYVFDWAAAAADDLDAVGVEHILGAVAHVAGEKHTHTHACHGWSNVGFAATALWGWQIFGSGHLTVFNGRDGVMVTMSKMVVDAAVSGW